MKHFFIISLFIISCGLFYSPAYSYLSIDTNILLTNISVTNIPYKVTVEPEIPTSFLKTGKIEFLEPQTAARRFDIIYFVSVPITFYLTMNILQIVNMNINGGRELNTMDWNYIYLNTLLIPMFVAIKDYQYMVSKGVYEKPVTTSYYKEVRFDVPVFAMQF